MGEKVRIFKYCKSCGDKFHPKTKFSYSCEKCKKEAQKNNKKKRVKSLKKTLEEKKRKIDQKYLLIIRAS